MQVTGSRWTDLVLAGLAAEGAAVVTTTAAAAEATLAGSGQSNADAAAVQVLLVHLVDGVVGRLLGAEGDEAEATGAAALAVDHDDGVSDLTKVGESLTKTVGVGGPGEVADVELGGHVVGVVEGARGKGCEVGDTGEKKKTFR